MESLVGLVGDSSGPRAAIMMPAGTETRADSPGMTSPWDMASRGVFSWTTSMLFSLVARCSSFSWAGTGLVVVAEIAEGAMMDERGKQ